MTTSRLSRRSLFGLGLGRVVEEHLGTLDAFGAALGAPPQLEDGSARRREDARAAWGAGDPRPLSRRLEPAAARLLEACGVERGWRVLDVAAGDGNLALAAARVGAAASAGDLSPTSVERGEERARVAGLEVDWGVADAEALPYADASFDLVASNFGVIHAEDPRRAMGELERVVRPGGLVGVTAWTSSGPMARILRLATTREGTAEAGARPERWGRYETAFLHFSRFDEFEMLDATLSMTFADEDELWAVLSDPPGPLARVVATGSDPGDVRRHVLELLAGHRRELTQGLRLDLPYVILLGRRQPSSDQHSLDRPETT